MKKYRLSTKAREDEQHDDKITNEETEDDFLLKRIKRRTTMLMHLLRSSLRVVIASSSSFNSSVSSSKTPKIRLMTSEKTLDTKEEKNTLFTTKIIVLGTNHNSSSDAEKVTRVIEDEKPDVVVVELDFERLNSNFNSFKKQGGGGVKSSSTTTRSGEDFMNAVKSGTTTNTQKEQQPIVLLGDVKAKEIPEMLLSKATSIENVTSVFPGGLVYFLESFKGAFGVAPTASVLTITLACALLDHNFIELFVLLYGVAVVSDVLLKDRDDILAENVLKGVDIAKRLRKKELISKQFTFSSSSSSSLPSLDDDDNRVSLDELPVFTLKRPFESRDEIRRLNLFEPRWLRMLDEIARRNDGSLVGAKLGVVLAQNRLYTPENFDDVGDDDFDDTSKSNENETRNKRVARIVFDPFVQRAKVVDAKESSRPVTGARKVEVFVALDSEANDDFIGEFREAPGQRGYMLASKKTPTGDRGEPTKNEARDEKEANDGSGRVVKCVVVCGKLHVRGVVGRLRMHLDNDDSVSSSDNSSDSGGVVVTM